MFDKEIKTLWNRALATTTDKTVRSEINTFLLVCNHFGWNPVPVSETDVLRYIVVLNKSLSYLSIKRYIGAVKHLHRAWGHHCVIGGSYHVYRVLQGIKRTKGAGSLSKLHITPKILEEIYMDLDISMGEDLVFWCGCLIAFLSFFRKGNICVEKEGEFNKDKHLCKGDVEVGEEWIKLTLRGTKTIQFRERWLEVPIRRAIGSIFDLGVFWKAYEKWDKGGKEEAALAVTSKGKRSTITHKWFTERLRKAIANTGRNPREYSGHSFRSGGATFAFECGIQMEVIKLQGDWLSDAYLRYIRVDWSHKQRAAADMAKALMDR